MRRVFVDTGAWFSFFVRSDPDHDSVVDALERHHDRLVTTDWVLDELATLILMRAGHARAVEAGQAIRSGGLAHMLHLDPADVDGAWEIFATHDDKKWSLTDCSSFSLMRRLGIDTAVAVDGHFRQAGFNVLP